MSSENASPPFLDAIQPHQTAMAAGINGVATNIHDTFKSVDGNTAHSIKPTPLRITEIKAKHKQSIPNIILFRKSASNCFACSENNAA